MDANNIPVLPESAPFTPEQRAYLNGFFAGLFSRAQTREIANTTPLTILFGSQTGNAEGLAKRVARTATRRGFATTVHDLGKYPAAQLASETRLLIVTSTYGDGDPPDNARAFWDFLSSDSAPCLKATSFSVCALGDSNYAKFCGFGRALDARLESLGANRIHVRGDCDVEYEEPFVKWLDAALRELREQGRLPKDGGARVLASPDSPVGLDSEEQLPAPNPTHTRDHPFPATLVRNIRLNGPDSAKDTRHLEIKLDDPGLAYDVGDALGVIPVNCSAAVGELLAALECSGEEAVPGRDGTELALRDALLRHYEITKIPRSFLEAMTERSGDNALRTLAAAGANGELTRFLKGREIIDLLLAHPGAKFTPVEFVGLLKKLPPRLYSISSSPNAHPGQVHLTVSIVRYESLGRPRKGVCSTFLADLIPPHAPVPVFIQKNQQFRPPPSGHTPMIMVGPGTGIAPFRAFLEERRATGAVGKNWLLFGDQRSNSDFLYREELESFHDDGLLNRLDLAWSRDQAEKVYVQHRMLENAGELFDWLEQGASFYVCGDASRMARDVDDALRQVIETGGARTAAQAADYVKRLVQDKRYLRDIY